MALQFGAMAGFPLPEQSTNNKRYLISCQFDSRKTESEEKAHTQTSSIDHALNSQTIFNLKGETDNLRFQLLSLALQIFMRDHC